MSPETCETLNRYRLWPDPDDETSRKQPAKPEQKTRKTERLWSAKALYLSEIALVVEVVPGETIGAERLSREELNKAELRTLVRDLHLRVRQFGYHQPCVLMLCAGGELLSCLRPLSSDQEWHQGDFLVFVETDEGADERIAELLSPTVPNQSVSLSPAEPQDATGLLRELREVQGGPLLLDEFHNSPGELQKNKEENAQLTAAQQWQPQALSALPEISRVRSLHPHNFRAFSEKLREPHGEGVGTDADLVLVVGPNGTGKSSILEALSMLLNGGLLHRRLDDLHHCYSSQLQNDPTQDTEAQDTQARDNEIQDSKAQDSEIQDSQIQDSKAQEQDNPVQAAQGEHTGQTQAREFTLEAKVEVYQPDAPPKPGSKQTIDLKVSHTHGQSQPELRLGTVAHLSRTVFSGLRGESERLEEGQALNARVSAWFAESVNHLLDETAKGLTLLDVFAPQPQQLRRLDDWLVSQQELTEQKLTQLENEEVDRDLLSEAEQALRSWLKGLIGELIDLYPLVEAYPTHSVGTLLHFDFESQDFRTALKQWLVSLRKLNELEFRPEGLQGAINDVIREVEKQIRAKYRLERRAASEELGTEDEDIKTVMERLQTEREAAMAHLKLLMAETAFGDGDRLSLFDVVKSLNANLERWKEALKQPDLRQLTTSRAELEEINPVALRKLASELSIFQNEQQNLIQLNKKKLEALEKRLEEQEQDAFSAQSQRELDALKAIRTQVKDYIEKLLPEERPPREIVEGVQLLWRRVDGSSERNRQREREQQRLNAIKALQNVRTLQMSPKIRHELTGYLRYLTNILLDRFSFELRAAEANPGETVRLEVEEKGDKQNISMSLQDGRRHVHWSLGQTAQLATVYMIAQNQLLAHLGRLPHRVLLLDDVSTAYDLSNITREALLWRQIAFATAPEQRRQIFLSSHHEELTHHLLDLLIPPRAKQGSQENKVLLIRFLQWTSKNGPDFETYLLEADQASVYETGPLKHALKEHLSL